METMMDSQTPDNSQQAPARPEFLKILCILSFIACGLMILLYTFGSFCLALNEEMVNGIWEKVVESNQQLENVNPMDFFHEFGMVCVYSLIINVFSLLGVIMMWRLERIGFFIYTIAELSSNFVSMDLNMGEESKSYGGLIFSVVIDLAFIVMYFMNLKHMNKKNNNTFVQSGS
jgi:hypothetical protein